MRTTPGLGRLCLTLTLASLMLAGCGRESAQTAPPQAAGQEPPPLQAQVLEVQSQDLPVDKRYSALIRSEQQVTVTARVLGSHEDRHYEEGARVERGELLFTIEPARYEASVRQRQADLQSAEAELYRAQRTAERFERLFEQNTVS